MIEELLLLNFQKHKKICVRFGPNITTILGPSDTGKSSIIRALRWIMLNQPRGSLFTSHGQDICSVRLIVDGHKIIRKKGKGENSYKLNKSRPFNALGAAGTVPEDIAKILNVENINFQLQLDPPFWFCLTSGEIAKELNSVINLGMIDRVFSSVSSQLKKARMQESICKERHLTAIREESKLSWINDCANHHDQLEELEKEISTKAIGIDSLANLINRVSSLTNEAHDALEVSSQGQKVLDLYESFIKTSRRVTRLEDLIMEYHDNELDHSFPNIDNLSELIGSLILLRQRHTALSQMVKELKKAEEELCEENILRKKLEEKMNKQTICPLCGKKR